jgi:hypothetical protein
MLSWLILISEAPSLTANGSLVMQNLAQIDLGEEITAIAVNPHLNRIYVGTKTALEVVDGASKQVTKTIDFGSEVSWVFIAQSSGQIWVNVDGDQIYVINPETYTQRGTGLKQQFQDNIAIDPERNRIYASASTYFKDDFDTIQIYNLADSSLLGHIDIPGSNVPKYVSPESSLLLDVEQNRIYAQSLGEVFLFDCATQKLVANATGNEFWSVQPDDQIYQGKIYTSLGIIDSSSFNYVSHFSGFSEPVALDPANSIVYGLVTLPIDSKPGADLSAGLKYELSAMNMATNAALANSTTSFTFEQAGGPGAVNPKTGEVYMGGEAGTLYALTMTEAQSNTTPNPKESQPTSIVPTVLYATIAIVVIAIVAVTATILRMRLKRK